MGWSGCGTWPQAAYLVYPELLVGGVFAAALVGLGELTAPPLHIRESWCSTGTFTIADWSPYFHNPDYTA